jgi:hypothetical protein
MLLLLALPVSAAEKPVAADWGVEQLMRGLASVKSANGKFVERKQLAILIAPLESSGVLSYTAPGRLEKRTLRPRPETLLLDRDRLTIESSEKKLSRTLNLQQYPLVWALVEGIRSTLAGDVATLRRFYQLSLEGGESRWFLVLRPLEPQMREVLTEIRISGSAHRIDSIEVAESGGDRSVMMITGDAS